MKKIFLTVLVVFFVFTNTFAQTEKQIIFSGGEVKIYHPTTDSITTIIFNDSLNDNQNLLVIKNEKENFTHLFKKYNGFYRTYHPNKYAIFNIKKHRVDVKETYQKPIFDFGIIFFILLFVTTFFMTKSNKYSFEKILIFKAILFIITGIFTWVLYHFKKYDIYEIFTLIPILTLFSTLISFVIAEIDENSKIDKKKHIIYVSFTHMVIALAIWIYFGTYWALPFLVYPTFSLFFFIYLPLKKKIKEKRKAKKEKTLKTSTEEA